MYNADLLYQQTSKQTGINAMEVRSAVTHYFKTIKVAVKNLEAPAHYIDFIGTIHVRKSQIEKEMKKLVKLYRQCKKFYYRNPIRNYKILAYVRTEISRLNRIRKALKIFYQQKKDNRANRIDKRILATSLGYYRGTDNGGLAQADKGQGNFKEDKGAPGHL